MGCGKASEQTKVKLNNFLQTSQMLIQTRSNEKKAKLSKKKNNNDFNAY